LAALSGDEAARALGQGAALLQVSRPGDALEHLRRAAALDPQDGRSRSMIAAALLALDRPAEAVDAAEAAIAIEPERAYGHRVRAIALEKLGRDDASRAAALEACRLEPEEPLSYVVLSSTLQAAGDEARNQLGLVLLRHDRPADAERAFRDALALNPHHAAALNNLSVARLRQGDRAAALGGFEQATGADPRMSAARKNVLTMAEHARWWRRLSVLCALGAVLVLVFAHGSGRIAAPLVFLAVGTLFEVLRRRSLEQLSEPSRIAFADDARSRRLKPWRWNWKWPTRLRPWWWLALERAPWQTIVPANLGLVVLGLLAQNAVLVVIFALGLPFSARKTWRAWRRAHPGRGSWRPPAE
jgi:tetratricopeptide (TPR) repeat protein